MDATDPLTTRHPAGPAPAVSVVVPVHNEAGNVGPLLAEIAAVLDPLLDYELLVVDDGSTDGTAGVLSACRAGNPRLRPLRHLRNSGQSAAIITGVRAARAPWIVTLDGDGQNDPADIPALLARTRGVPTDAAPAMVAGWRVARQDTWLKRVSSKIANGVRGWILSDHTPDGGCGLKAFRRDVFLKLPCFDHMHRFLPALFERAGGAVVSVPVGHRPRSRGRSHYGLHDRLWSGIVDLFGVIWLGRRMTFPDAVELTASADSGPAGPDVARAPGERAGG